MPDLRRQFLDYHEHALKSSVGTLRRYLAVTHHLEDFAGRQTGPRRRLLPYVGNPFSELPLDRLKIEDA